MNRQQLIEVFKDTLEKTKDYTNSITTKYNFSEINSKVKSKSPVIQVINLDSVSALIEYSKYGKTCVLNMASSKHSGGGVQKGARAQEECLYRCSNLALVVPQSFYPLEIDECLYTKNAVFIKDFYYNIVEPVVSDVVTIAALNLNFDSKPVDYINIMMNKIRLMLTMAGENGCDNVILGSWGCGVFGNNPMEVASMFRKVLIKENYGGLFKNVIFAIINDSNSVDDNFNVFKNIL